MFHWFQTDIVASSESSTSNPPWIWISSGYLSSVWSYHFEKPDLKIQIHCLHDWIVDGEIYSPASNIWPCPIHPSILVFRFYGKLYTTQPRNNDFSQVRICYCSFGQHHVETRLHRQICRYSLLRILSFVGYWRRSFCFRCSTFLLDRSYHASFGDSPVVSSTCSNQLEQIRAVLFAVKTRHIWTSHMADVALFNLFNFSGLGYVWRFPKIMVPPNHPF